MSVHHRQPMRTLSATVASLTLVGAALTGCAAGTPGASESATAKDPADVKIGLQLLFSGVTFSTQTQAGAQHASDELGTQLIANATPTLDPPAAQAQVTSAIAGGVDGFVIGPEPAALWTRTLTDAYDALGGRTIAFNSVPDAAARVGAYVGVDAPAMGEALVEETVKASGLDASTTGYVLIGQCVMQSEPLTLQVDAMIAKTKELLPNVTVDRLDSNVVPSENFVMWEQAAQAHPDLVLAMGSCDQDGASMVKARETSGLDFKIGAANTDAAVIQGLRDGSVVAVVGGNFFLVGYTATRLLAESAITGKTVPSGWYDTGWFTLTGPDAADTAAAKDADEAGLAAFYAPIVEEFWSDIDAQLHSWDELRG